MSSEIFFSYIIPTIGRASLERAVNSVLSQDFSQADFEVIVVNDSGKPLPEAAWQASPRVRSINTNKTERSVARNSGAAIAKGKYLAFLDDDDWILPGTLEIFWKLANEHPDAIWLYGGIRVVDGQNRILTESNSRLSGNCFAQVMGDVWVAIQSSMIQARAFFEIGCYNPLICGTEDEDLCRRAAYHGEFANTEKIVACLFRGPSWNTSTDYQRAVADVKYSRDFVLSKDGAFQRLMKSTDSNYWQGRVLRVYLSTIPWNLKRKRYFTALSRLSYSFLAAVRSLHRFGASEFRAGLSAHHPPDTLHFVMEQHHPGSKPGKPTR